MFFGLVKISQAATYYVETTGKDSNPGSEAQPWLTIQKSATTAQAGDTVYIKSGTYAELITIANSGTSGNYITFKEYPGATVIIDGTGKAGWWGVISIHGKDYIKIEDLEIKNNTTGWGVLVEHEEGNAAKGATNIILLNLNVHDTAGEGIQVRGNASDITIENCRVYNGLSSASGIDTYQWGGGRPHNVAVKNCTVYNIPGFACIGSEQADNLIVENNLCYSSEMGIDIGSGDNNIIRNNIVHDVDTGIMLSSNEDSLVYNNTVYNIISEALYNYCWILHGEGHARNKWFNNVVHDAGWAVYESARKSDSYGICPSSGHEYYNNLFYNIGVSTYRKPFYFYGVTGTKFYHNTVYINFGYDAITFISGATGAEIKNNIISIAGGKLPVIIDALSQAGASIDYNLYHDRTAVLGSGTEAHSLYDQDPLFSNAAGGNFHLTESSPAIDKGVNLGINTDMEGNVRPQGAGYDMGAYESVYAAPDTTPPAAPTGVVVN
jgi:parallel beta-helix repeat protein